MSRLDDPAVVASLDRQDFLSAIEALPEQVAGAWASASSVLVSPARPIEGIAVLGMGGSGISGDVVKAILGPFFALPVEVCKGYEPPAWIGPSTLVFAVSYSGGTEETLESFDRVRVAGAQIVAVSTGGMLRELAAEYGRPWCGLPSGLQPRAALGYLAFSILAVCQRLGLADLKADVEETVALLESRRREWERSNPADSNPAKALARQLLGTVPVVYGSEGIAAVSAYRWKCQFNECSKVHAFSGQFSEINHNEIVGWTEPLDEGCRFGVVVLRHAGEHRRIADRLDVTLPMIGSRPAVLRVVQAKGQSRMARLMDLISFGDYVATYLALARGVDPSEIELIERVKQELSLR